MKRPVMEGGGRNLRSVEQGISGTLHEYRLKDRPGNQRLVIEIMTRPPGGF